MLGFYNYTVVLTYVGMLTGFAGILFAAGGQVSPALLCLLGAGFCDMFDGKIASTRPRTQQEKRFGIQIDSLSDLVCFGVLPAVIVWCAAGASPLSLCVGGGYALCALIRLAWFNVDEEERQAAEPGSRTLYYGLPVTGSALILPGVLALAVRLGLAMAMPGVAALCLMAVGFLTPFPLKKPQAAGKARLVLADLPLDGGDRRVDGREHIGRAFTCAEIGVCRMDGDLCLVAVFLNAKSDESVGVIPEEPFELHNFLFCVLVNVFRQTDLLFRILKPHK